MASVLFYLNSNQYLWEALFNLMSFRVVQLVEFHQFKVLAFVVICLVFIYSFIMIFCLLGRHRCLIVWLRLLLGTDLIKFMV